MTSYDDYIDDSETEFDKVVIIAACFSDINDALFVQLLLIQNINTCQCAKVRQLLKKAADVLMEKQFLVNG